MCSTWSWSCPSTNSPSKRPGRPDAALPDEVEELTDEALADLENHRHRRSRPARCVPGCTPRHSAGSARGGHRARWGKASKRHSTRPSKRSTTQPKDLPLPPEEEVGQDEVRIGNVTLSHPVRPLPGRSPPACGYAAPRAGSPVDQSDARPAPLHGDPCSPHAVRHFGTVARFPAPQHLAKALELAQQRLADHDRALDRAGGPCSTRPLEAPSKACCPTGQPRIAGSRARTGYPTGQHPEPPPG